jgi:hypothetical protein
MCHIIEEKCRIILVETPLQTPKRVTSDPENMRHIGPLM